MQALILAASLVAPAPREALPRLPDLATLHHQYTLGEDRADERYGRGVIVERVEIDRGSQRGWMVRSGPYRLRFMGGREEARGVDGQTLRLRVVPRGIGSDTLILDAWVMK